MSRINKVLKALEMALELPRGSREQPMNVAHQKLLILVYLHPDIKTDELLPYFYNEKPTLISRINFLERKQLLIKLPKYNAGGNTHPNYYRLTQYGKKLVSLFQ